MDRGTVSKYWDCTEPVEEPRSRERSRKIDSYRDSITERLEKYPELSAQRLYGEIVKRGYTGSERSVRRHVAMIRPKKVREYKPVEVLPGEQAQADWGHFGSIVEHGRRVKLYAFILTLSWSRAMYVEFITSLDAVTFAGCLHRAFAYLGGVPTSVLFDNAKTVVADRVGSVVQFNADLLRMSLRYGFTPKACWVSDPESKGRVESNVKYVRNGFFYGHEWNHLEQLNAAVHAWLQEVAEQRIHGTTGEKPAKLLEEERPHLQAFVTGDGPMGILTERPVSKDGLIKYKNSVYSIPAQFARKSVRLRCFERYIEIFDGEKVVFRHDLAHSRNQRVIIEEHYPQHARKGRHTHPLQMQFEAMCPSAAAYLKGLSQTSRRRTGSLREHMDAILALHAKYGTDALEQAMQRALDFGAFGASQLQRIVERQTTAPTSLPRISAVSESNRQASPVPTLQRDPAYYEKVLGL